MDCEPPSALAQSWFVERSRYLYVKSSSRYSGLPDAADSRFIAVANPAIQESTSWRCTAFICPQCEHVALPAPTTPQVFASAQVSPNDNADTAANAASFGIGNTPRKRKGLFRLNANGDQ